MHVCGQEILLVGASIPVCRWCWMHRRKGLTVFRFLVGLALLGLTWTWTEASWLAWGY